MFAPLYEFFHYSVPFSDDLFDEGVYGTLGLYAVLISFAFVMLFYYVINRPAFSRWYHWAIILGINFLTAFSLGAFIPKTRFSALGIQYSSEYYAFALKNALIASCFFILLSFGLRWWSTNAKRTPIPH